MTSKAYALLTCLFVVACTAVVSAEQPVKFTPPAGASCAKATMINADGAIVTRYVCVVKGK